MRLPFRKPRFTQVPASARKPLDTRGHRLIAQVPETGAPIFALPGHSLNMAAAGSGKTSAGASVWLMSLMASTSRPAILVSDPKNAELTQQFVPALRHLGIPFGVIDDSGVLPIDFPGRVSLNPIASVVESFSQTPEDLLYALEEMALTLVEEPPEGDMRNKYFRNWPRWIIEFATMVLLKRNPQLATPAGLWALISNAEMFARFVAIEADEGDGMLQVMARNMRAMSSHDHWAMHLSEAQQALRTFSIGTRLASAGHNATTTPAALIRKRAVVFLCGSQRHIRRMGPYYAMVLGSFLDALHAGAGPITFINDEFTNAPLQTFVSALTTDRGPGGEAHNICQSRSEIEKKFGKQSVETIEENAVVKIWYGISGFSEARLLSEMIGEELAVQPSLGTDSDALRLQTNLSLTKQRWMSPGDLMALKPHQLLLHVRGLGFYVADKVWQNNLNYHELLAPNAIEGGKLPYEPRFTLPFPGQAA